MSEVALQIIKDNIKAFENGEDARLLDLGYCGITVIPEEIKYCTWVEELMLGHGGSYSKEGISGSDLIYLENDTVENDITFLPESFANLVNLKHLWIDGNEHLVDIGPVRFLKNLKQLDISHTAVDDISPISGLNNLSILVADYSRITNIYPIAHLKNLKILDIRSTLITDIKALQSLTNLEKLDISKTDIKDLSPVSNLKKLKVLNLYSTK